MTTRRYPEQSLIDLFVEHLRKSTDPRISIKSLLNKNCRSKKLSDVEYISQDDTHWVIEAKSDDSGDKHNTVHKIFGELLKETGRDKRHNNKYSVLIPEASVAFYSRAFQAIHRDKFLAFGALIPVDSVFLCGSDGIRTISWADLYESHKV